MEANVHLAGRHHAHPQAPGGRDIIVYDASVPSATRVREVIIWMNDAGESVATATENVLLLPTSLAPDATVSGLPTTSISPYPTQTLVVPSSMGPKSAGNRGGIAISAYIPPIATASGALPSQETGKPANVSGSQPATSELFGVSYTPYRADQNCKSQQDVDDDFKRLAGSFSLVRVYGTDCDQVPMLHSAAKTHAMKLFLGIWNPSSVEDEANKIISGIKGDWDMVHTVSVGNELVNNGEASPEEMIQSMKKARSLLRAAGFKGPVVTVDTFTAALAHPELCDESDYCAINAHAFFDSTVSASQSGTWLENTVSQVQSAISGNKKVVVTETGWPMKGATNGLAVPSLQNQKVALEAIKGKFASNPGDVILFSAFNDLWKKKDMATFDADQYWGINGAVSSCDQ